MQRSIGQKRDSPLLQIRPRAMTVVMIPSAPKRAGGWSISKDIWFMRGPWGWNANPESFVRISRRNANLSHVRYEQREERENINESVETQQPLKDLFYRLVFRYRPISNLR